MTFMIITLVPLGEQNGKLSARQDGHDTFIQVWAAQIRLDRAPVEFEPGHVPGLALIRMQDELSALLGGRQVDLVTPKFLHPRIRDRVLAEMEVQYAQG